MFYYVPIPTVVLILLLVNHSHNVVIRNEHINENINRNLEEYRYNKLIAQVFNINRGSFHTRLNNNEPCSKGECVPRALCDERGFIKVSEGMQLESKISKLSENFDANSATGQTCNGPDEVCCRPPETADYDDDIDSQPQMQVGCGYQPAQDVFESRIAGGDKSKSGEFPWMMAILQRISDNRYQYAAGGSLVHPSIVMTTAHSVASIPMDKLIVRAGGWDIQSESTNAGHQDRTVKRIIYHSLYNNRTLTNDIALLVLDRPFQIGSSINTICLPPSNVFTEPGVRCMATGWGRNRLGPGGRYQRILQQIELPVVSHMQCQNSLKQTRLGRYYRLHRGFMCAGGEADRDTCKGDGGSPLVCHVPNSPGRFYQAGIVAGGVGCGGSVPGIYTNVAFYTDWVMRQMHYVDMNMPSEDTLKFKDFFNEFRR